MATPLASLLDSVDQAIREGRTPDAQKALAALNRRKIPRELALRVASLARRANATTLAIRVLNPIVRPSRRSPAVASPEEKAEYAACLTKIGAGEEALALLESLDAGRQPAVYLYRAFALVRQWDYGATIPLLEKYLAYPDVPDYQRCVAKANLAAALVVEHDTRRATALIAELLEETRAPGRSLLHGNTLDLAAQNAILREAWQDAERYLALIESRAASEPLSAFFARKWRVILDLHRSKGSAESIQALKDLRRQTLELAHWESVRDCDRYEADITGDERLFTHVYFGTPHPAFRRYLLRDFARGYSPPESYVWKLSSAKASGPTLDLLSGSLDRPAPPLKLGQVPHRLLIALSSDFYRPYRLPALHFRLYPEECFNPTSSPLRVHQALWELRKWITKAKFPVEIEELDGFYRLRPRQTCAIEVPLHGTSAQRETLLVRQLARLHGDGWFSAQQAAESLSLSSRSAVRVLGEAVREGKVERAGVGSATRYRVAPPLSAAKTRA